MSKFFQSILIATLLSSLIACKNTATKPTSITTAKEESTAAERTYPDRENSAQQIKKPIVLMISIDGFRNDYLEMYNPATLLKWAHSGVRSNGLIPSFPTLTFPNHMTLVTGLRPGHHGIVGNKFYDETRKQFYALGDNTTVNDGSWYRGTPIWTSAENQGMLSATCYWVGSEAKIGGVDPTYYKPYADHMPSAQRIAWVKEWLLLPENKKPHFIGLYFSKVDTAGHKFGPQSEEVRKAISEIDTKLAELDRFIQDNKIDVNIVVVSDHGMKMIDKTADISSLVASHKVKTNGRGPVVMLYAEDKNDVESIYRDAQKLKGSFKTYKSSQLPKRWALDDQERRGDVVLVANLGVYINFKDPVTGKEYLPGNVASHGWDTKGTQELNGVFIATGPQFKKEKKIPAFDNVHVYPMVMHILDLKIEGKIDGKLQVLKSILAR